MAVCVRDGNCAIFKGNFGLGSQNGSINHLLRHRDRDGFAPPGTGMAVTFSAHHCFITAGRAEPKTTAAAYKPCRDQ